MSQQIMNSRFTYLPGIRTYVVVDGLLEFISLSGYCVELEAKVYFEFELHLSVSRVSGDRAAMRDVVTKSELQIAVTDLEKLI